MYNVGELVRVKDDADKIKVQGIGFTSLMKEYLGQTLEVKEYINPWYKLEQARDELGNVNGDSYWWWAEEWLEPASVNIEEITKDEIISILEES